jgi:hypothetical protein
MSFTGGKLKLKGGDVGKRKKKRKSKDAGEGASAGALVLMDGAEGSVAAVQNVRATKPDQSVCLL